MVAAVERKGHLLSSIQSLLESKELSLSLLFAAAVVVNDCWEREWRSWRCC